LKVSAINGEHDGPAGPWIEYAGEAILHAALEVMRAFQKEAVFLRRDLEK